MAKVL